MNVELLASAPLANAIVPYLQAIGWALIHFLWQGSLVAVVTAFLLMLSNNARAQTRYAIACIALLICALLPIWELLQSGIGSQSDAAVVMAQTVLDSGAAKLDLSLRQQLEIWLQNHLLQMVAVWLIVVSLLICRMLLGLWWLQSYQQGKRGVAHPALQRQLDQLSHAFALSKQVILRVVDDIESPITIGSLRPMVLVPASLVTGMSPAYLEALLAHELAHISRYDYLFNLMQNLIESFLFFHPAVWWISKKIRNEREHIADDLAASVLGEPRRLALALQELDQIRFTTPQLAQAAHGGHLMSRIKRLVRPEIHSMNWKTAVTLVASTVAGFTLAANAAVPVVSPQTIAPADFVETEVAVAAAAMPEKETTKPVVRKNTDVVVPARIDFEKQGCRPEYPRSALRNEHQGTTSLAVTIAKNGRVAGVKVLRSSGYDSLDNAVKNQLLSPACKMQAGTVNGVPQKLTTQVQYVWRLDGDDKKQKTQVEIADKATEQNQPAGVNFELPGCRPEYPRASLRNEETGTTHLSLHVNETGAISEVKILKSSGFRGLDNAVRNQLLLGQCKAQPAVEGGKMVASNANIQYLWKLD